MVPRPDWRSRTAKPALRQRPIGGVDVAVLELRRARRRSAAERPDLLGREIALGGGEVHDAVLELDLDRASDGRAHARGSSEPAPAPGRRGAATTPP